MLVSTSDSRDESVPIGIQVGGQIEPLYLISYSRSAVSLEESCLYSSSRFCIVPSISHMCMSEN